jgi:hypothetical protein
VRNNLLVLMVLAGLGTAAGCGGGHGQTHHGTSSSSAQAGSGNGPLPTTSPRGESDTGTCASISYRITTAGVEISARVAKTPAKLNFEADDQDDNPVTGDPDTSGVTYAFNGTDTQRTLVVKGVKSLDHLTVIALGTSQDDSCRVYAR